MKLIFLSSFIWIISYGQAFKTFEVNEDLGLVLEQKSDLILTTRRAEFELHTEMSIPQINIEMGCAADKNFLNHLSQRFGLTSQDQVETEKYMNIERVKKLIEAEIEIKNREIILELSERFMHFEFNPDNKEFKDVVNLVSGKPKAIQNDFDEQRSADQKVPRVRRSLIEYWKSGGLLNSLTGRYTDKKFNENDKKIEDFKNQQKFIDRDMRDQIFKVQYQVTEIQNRLNDEICSNNKVLMEDIVSFEILMIQNMIEVKFENSLKECFATYVPQAIKNRELKNICKNIIGDDVICEYPNNLFQCQNKAIGIKNDKIIHQMKIVFLYPLLNYRPYIVHTLPVPIAPNEYSQLEMNNVRVFVNSQQKAISFVKCEKRRMFEICEIENSSRIFGKSECIESLISGDSIRATSHCKSSRFTDQDCIYSKIKDLVVLSSYEFVTIRKITENNMSPKSENFIGQYRGVVPLKLTNIAFECAENFYQIKEEQVQNIVLENWNITFNSGGPIHFNESVSPIMFERNVLKRFSLQSFVDLYSLGLAGVYVMLIIIIGRKIYLMIRIYRERLRLFKHMTAIDVSA